MVCVFFHVSQDNYFLQENVRMPFCQTEQIESCCRTLHDSSAATHTESFKTGFSSFTFKICDYVLYVGNYTQILYIEIFFKYLSKHLATDSSLGHLNSTEFTQHWLHIMG